MIEDRNNPRFAKQSFTVFVERVANSFDGGDEADIVVCKTVDLSADGVQVVVDSVILKHKILRLCLDVRGKPPIYVVGEVIWQTYEPSSGDYPTGFRLYESQGTDYPLWRQTIAELLQAD